LLSCKANKKLVQQRMQETNSKPVVLKDLANIVVHMKSSTRPNNISDLVRELSADGASSVSVMSNEENEFRGITYQDAYMRQVFETYPEIVLMDATYKLVDLRLPAYILCAIDGNGMTEVVFVFLVVDETKDTNTKSLQIFKDTNPAWSKTLSFMTDKDFVERDVIQTLFPSVSVLTCRYHTLSTFRRELTTEKMSISAAQRDICLSIVSDMVYATNEVSYEQQRQRLLNLNLAKVTEYFSTWHDIRHEWVEGLSRLHMTLGETTNN